MLEALRDRRLGRVLGWLVVALALGFVGARLWQGGAWDLVRPRLGLLLATTGGALLYGLAGFLLSAAWREILAAERPPGPAAAYHAVYGRTQIAKYLPGNCFHFVGRQILGRALGHSQGAFFAGAGGVLWLLAVPLVAPQAPAPGPLTSIGALALAWVAGFVVPGAAAGVGVREAVLIVALDGPLGPGERGGRAGVRLVTTDGEGVFCALALTLPMPPRSTSAPVAKQTSRKRLTKIKVNITKPK
jgi:hypothetical protein